MKNWYDLVSSISTYNPESKGKITAIPDNVELSRNLSPLTNFFLNVFVNCFEKRNLIIAIPDTILRPIPIISYLYDSLIKKSVIVFTQRSGAGIRENPIVAHNRNYHLLNSDGNYLFYNTPIGVMSDGDVKAKVYLPRAKKSVRPKYIQQQKKNFLEMSSPKILLYYDENNSRITNTIEKIILDDGRLDGLSVGIDIGLVIFENVDRFVNSQYSTQLFLKWISPLLNKRINLLFHFANPESKFIQTIKEESDSLVIPFGHSLLRSNAEIKKASIEYFKNKRKNATEMLFLEKYNIDRTYFYEETTTIEILEPLLEAGNIDYHFRNAKSLLRKIDEERLINKRLYFRLIGLLFKLPNIIINPSKYKECYDDGIVGWRRYTIHYLLQILRDRLHEEDEKNRVILEELICEIYCIYLELKECMRYGEEGTYSRVAKDYKIMELFNKIASNRDDRKCYIATYSPNERNILEEEVNKLGLENGFEVKAIKQINQSMFAKSDATLILPGPLRMKYLSELLRPYKKIIILAYDGENCNIAKDQIDLFYTYSFEQERNSMLYLGEVYEFLGIQKDGLFKDYYDREKTIELKLEQKEFKPITRKEIEEKIEVIDRIKKIISINPRYTDYREYEEEVAHIENTMTALDKEQNEKSKSGICYEVSLRKVDNTSLIRKLLPIEKTYLYLEEIDGEVREGIPRNLQTGYFVVILGNDERKTLLEIVLEIFDLEESVDKYLIESWKKGLVEFIEKYDLSCADLYKRYIEKGGKRNYQTVLNWAKGNVLGPDDPIDLLIIGTILEDDEIIEDYNIIDREVRNLRVLHQTTGRKLRKIIKEILKGELDPAKLSYEEYMLYGKIEGGLYEIVDIMKRNSNDGGDR